VATVPTYIWSGVSGKAYTYHVYANPPNFTNPKEEGNYIYCRLVANRWVPVYIGEGCLADRCIPSHHKARCIQGKGATHVHAHLEYSELARKAEERDLLASHAIAYWPMGCNDKIGG